MSGRVHLLTCALLIILHSLSIPNVRSAEPATIHFRCDEHDAKPSSPVRLFDVASSRATPGSLSVPKRQSNRGSWCFEPFPLVPDAIPLGVVVELDLPELGLTDLAWVTEIAECPEIEVGDDRVVTATFHHSSGDVIDLMVEGASSGRSASEPETIGTTSNHPFWSVDRQEYVLS